LDLSDALHVALSASCAELATFDRRLSKQARRLGLKPTASTLTV
jgi:predicted nucleic acid-binding protein